VADGVFNDASSEVRRWRNGFDGMEESPDDIKKLECGLYMKVGHEVIHVDFKKVAYCHGMCILYLVR
jgi:hypothetical protein